MTGLIESHISGITEQGILRGMGQIVKERIEVGANEKAVLRLLITALSFASFRFFLVEQSASTLYGFLILMLYLCSIKRADKNGQNFKVCSYIAASEISLHWKLQKIFSYDMLTQHMWCWFYEILFCMQGNDFTTTG